MRRKYWLMLGVCFSVVAFDGVCANEPFAGAIVRKKAETTPSSDFRPGNITNIVPEVKKDKK